MMLKLHLLGGIFLLAMLGSCQAQSTPQQPTASDTDTTPASEPAEQTGAPTCPPPSTPLNGKVDTRLPESKVMFKCDDGYVLNGDETWECSAEGKWPNVTAPSCKEIECSTFPKPEHGKVSYKNATNVTATFTCDKDFTLEGSKVRICVNKKWTGEKTKCSSGGSINLVIIIVVALGVIAVLALGAVAVFFFMKRRKARSREVTRPAGGAYQAVETKTGGDGRDVEMGSKRDTGDEEKDK